MKLKDKVAIITGSSRGMGKATALLFAKEGAKVVVDYNKSKDKGQAVVDEIKNNGGEAILVHADISKPEDVKKLFAEAVKEFSTVDILVNNAGIVRPKPFLDLTLDDWKEMFAINVFGLFMCCQEAAKIIKKGKIINISSIRGIDYCGRGGILDYSASKAAVINITKTLAKELAPNINVNSIAPGFTETDMAKSWTAELKKKAVEATSLKRLVQPEEIAKASLFLASSDSDAITGQVLPVDVGFTLK